MTVAHCTQPAVLLIGHGTRISAGVEEFQCLLSRLQQALPDRLWAAGFLELAHPSLKETLQTLVAQGVSQITALPAMLLAAGHVKIDIPHALHAFQAEYPGVEIRYGSALGLTAKLLRAAQARIESCEAAFGLDYQRKDTLLLVIGRGCSDLDANADVSKLTRLLWESMGFGWAMTGYTAVAAPLIDEALEHARRLGYPNILVFPYLLFRGILSEQIQTTAETHQARHPDVHLAVAPYLRDHPLVVETFIERLFEAEKGDSRMNCHLCPYQQSLVSGIRFPAPELGG